MNYIERNQNESKIYELQPEDTNQHSLYKSTECKKLIKKIVDFNAFCSVDMAIATEIWPYDGQEKELNKRKAGRIELRNVEEYEFNRRI